ncbi:hypothetical protein J1N35_011058, partial [Gossypium stocksii]
KSIEKITNLLSLRRLSYAIQFLKGSAERGPLFILFFSFIGEINMVVLRFFFVPILATLAIGMIALPVTVQAQSPALAPAPGIAPTLAPTTNDGTSIDQGVAYVLMLVALLLTYMIHVADLCFNF